MTDLLSLDSYLIRRQILKIFGASFHVYSGDELVGFCAQKAFKLKEDIRIFTDESRAEALLEIKARQIVDFAAAYDVVDPRQGVKVGAARRKGMRSMLRDSWELLDANDQPLAQLQEDSMGMATLRRFLSNLIPQHFHLSAGGKTVANLRQHFNPFVYRLEVSVSQDCPIDRRLLFASAVLIAAIEGRQK